MTDVSFDADTVATVLCQQMMETILILRANTGTTVPLAAFFSSMSGDQMSIHAHGPTHIPHI